VLICQARGTIGWDDAWFQVQQDHPAHRPDAILDVLRKMEKVDFNPKNRVFTYIVSAAIYLSLYSAVIPARLMRSSRIYHPRAAR
jgi:hypothetical protein